MPRRPRILASVRFNRQIARRIVGTFVRRLLVARNGRSHGPPRPEKERRLCGLGILRVAPEKDFFNRILCKPPFVEFVEKNRIRCKRSLRNFYQRREQDCSRPAAFKNATVRERPFSGGRCLLVGRPLIDTQRPLPFHGNPIY